MGLIMPIRLALMNVKDSFCTILFRFANLCKPSDCGSRSDIGFWIIAGFRQTP